MATAMESLAARFEAALARLEALESKFNGNPAAASREVPSGAPAGSGLPPSVAAFDDLIDTAVKRVVVASEKLGGKVQEAAGLLVNAFAAERTVVLAISQCKKPSIEELQKLVTPVGEVIGKAATLTEGKRTEYFNNLKAIAESLHTLTWIVYTGKDCGMSLPAAHVEECWSAAEFYTNKILVENKNKNPDQVEWARALKDAFLPRLRDYVKQFHPTGPAWKANGIEVAKFDPAGGVAAPAPPPPAPAPAPATPPGPRPPPPPPVAPPPPPNFGGAAAAAAAPAGSAADMSKIFAAINQGEGVTAGLRKVTADMKTKNRADRSGAVPASPSPAAAAASPVKKTPTAPPKAPPLFELQQGRKWVIENQVDNKTLVVEETEAKQTVYIYGCKNCVIKVKGKVNSIALDKCTKTGVVFQDVVASCEVVNCASVEVQCEGSAPTVLIDNTSGCQLYLSKTSLNASITTAKSSEINVLVPGEGEDADAIEHALPEQFTHEFKDAHFVTTPVSHSGG